MVKKYTDHRLYQLARQKFNTNTVESTNLYHSEINMYKYTVFAGRQTKSSPPSHRGQPTPIVTNQTVANQSVRIG